MYIGTYTLKLYCVFLHVPVPVLVELAAHAVDRGKRPKVVSGQTSRRSDFLGITDACLTANQEIGLEQLRVA